MTAMPARPFEGAFGDFLRAQLPELARLASEHAMPRFHGLESPAVMDGLSAIATDHVICLQACLPEGVDGVRAGVVLRKGYRDLEFRETVLTHRLVDALLLGAWLHKAGVLRFET